jgi:ribosomal protein S18 acetylase RimI-like enzyme
MDASTRYFIETPDASDAADLSALAQRVFCATFADLNYPADDLAAFLHSVMGPERYHAQIVDPTYMVRIARDDSGQMIGFIKCGPTDLPLPSGEPDPQQTRELHQLYIDVAGQGTGLADALMHCALDDAAHYRAKALYLSVYIGNVRAQRFYARYGFTEIGKNPFAIGNTIDDDRIWKLSL